MKIAMQTWGTEGDLRPFFALADGLGRAGHEVELAYTCVDDSDFTPKLGPQTTYRHRRVGQLGITQDEMRALSQKIFGDPNPMRQLDSILQGLLAPVADALLEASVELAQSSELFIYHMLVPSAPNAAEKFNIPVVGLYTAPMFPTAEQPPPGMPNLGFINGIIWKLAIATLDKKLKPGVNGQRQKLGLPPVKLVQSLSERSRLDLVGVSPTLYPRPSDWPKRIEVCGFLNPRQTMAPAPLPSTLERFIEDGPPPVFVTFGSMSLGEKDPGALFNLVRDAIKKAGTRAIVQLDGYDGVEDPAIYPIGRVSHELVFPRCSAIVHHGGAGTTQSASLSGRPSVVVAHITDQFLWGSVLYRIGSAPKNLERRKLTAEKLANAIQVARNTGPITVRAREVAEKMRREDGVQKAVALIEAAMKA